MTPKLVTYSDPLSAEEHATLGAIYEREGNYERALEQYRAAVREDPKNLVALTGLGNLALHNGDPRLATRYYREALKLDPDNIAVLNNLALAWLEIDKPEKALEAASRAAGLDEGNDPRVLETLARAKLAVGDRQGALAVLMIAQARCQEICGTTAESPAPEEEAESMEPVCDREMAKVCQQIDEDLSLLNESRD